MWYLQKVVKSNSEVTLDLELKACSDASRMLHRDAKGHGGIIITYGGTVVATKSSTESKLVEESVPYVLWTLNLMENVGLKIKKPVNLMQ